MDAIRPTERLTEVFSFTEILDGCVRLFPIPSPVFCILLTYAKEITNLLFARQG